MEQKHTQFSALTETARPAAATSILHWHAPAKLDAEPVKHLVATKGRVETDELICRVLEDIAYRLDNLQTAQRGHDFDQIAKPARRIKHVAAQIGLTDVCLVAGSVADAADQSDGVALSATLARLERGFDVAVTEIWNYRS